MDKTTLVGVDVEAGSELLKALDQAKFKVSAAFWLAVPEFSDWRLWIASPEVDRGSAIDVYQKIHSILQTSSARGSIHLSQITAASPKDPLIRELRRIFGKTASVEGARIGGQTIGGRYVEEAFLYRVK